METVKENKLIKQTKVRKMKITKNKVIGIYRTLAECRGISETIIKEDIHKMRSSNMKNAVKIYQGFVRYCANNPKSYSVF